MSKFTILGETIVFDEGVDNYAVLRSEELNVMRKVVEKYKQIYDRYGKTKMVLEHYSEDVQTILNEIILDLYNRLVQYEIYDITQSAYNSRYGSSWEDVNDAYEELLNQYEEITLSEEERNAARTARRQNRGKIIGVDLD